MASSPELSVIVRSGSINAWLDQTLESVLASQDVDLELILVLNGPEVKTDEFSQAAEAKTYPWLKDSRVRVLRFDRYLGVSNAMRAGCAEARADLLANVDGDDLVSPGKFRRQLDYLVSHPDCVLLGTGGRLIDDQGQVTGELKAPQGDDIRRSLLLFNPLPHSSVVFRAQAYQQAGGYRKDLDQFEDYDLFLRLAQLGPVAMLPGQEISYRVHSKNTSKGAGARGQHIEAVTQGRRELAKALAVPAYRALPPHLLWRGVQFARAAGLIRPLHEYLTIFKKS